jgi:hypothetical protein
MLWPLTLAGPAGVAFVWWDARGEGREGAAEVAGASAFAVVPAMVALAAAWRLVPALALAVIMAGRSVPAVMTIRAYLRQIKGQSVSAIPALVTSAAAVAAAVLLVRLHLAPWAAALMSALMLVRAVVLLSPTRPRINASRVGLAEAILGGILIVGVALSWSH